MASGLTRNQVPGNRLRVRIPCPPLWQASGFAEVFFISRAGLGARGFHFGHVRRARRVNHRGPVRNRLDCFRQAARGQVRAYVHRGVDTAMTYHDFAHARRLPLPTEWWIARHQYRSVQAQLEFGFQQSILAFIAGSVGGPIFHFGRHL